MKGRGGIFEVIAQEAIMGIAAFNKEDGRCLYLNPLAREVLEAHSDDPHAIDLTISELLTSEDRPGIARAFREELLQQEGFHQDVLMRRKNGHFLVANVGVKHAVLESGERVALLMFQDVTIQKKLQREVQAKQEEIHKAYTELIEQNRQLKELDHAKDKFIGVTTHELRTPLSAIVATAEVLTLELYESSEQKEQFIRTIHEQGLHLMELVNDILDFAKIRAGKMDFYVEQVDLVPLVKKLTTNFDHMASQANVTLRVEAGAPQQLAWIDTLRIKEVINNVINNAIKYNQTGGSVVININSHPAQTNLIRVTVTDTGPGIAEDKIKHVFNEFETVGNISSHHKGTGLGMPISKRLIQTMGGDLTLESQVGKGTSFFIDVPCERVLSEEMYRSRPDAWDDLAA